MTEDTPHAALKAVIQRIEQEAYRRGWDDALSLTIERVKDVAGKTKPSSRQGPRAKYGSVQGSIKVALDQAGDKGLTTGEVCKTLLASGTDILSTSVSSALSRLVEKGIARKDGNRWITSKSPRDINTDAIVSGATVSMTART